MIEIRWLDGTLQYRSLRPSWLASGAWGEPSQWSAWQDVQHVTTEASLGWGNGPKKAEGPEDTEEQGRSTEGAEHAP